MDKCKLIVVLIVTLLLAGCSTNTPTYTIAYADCEKKVVYDTAGMLYVSTTSENNYEPLVSKEFECKPALLYCETDAQANLVEECPGLYTGSIQDGWAYITTLTTNGYTIDDYVCTPYDATYHLSNGATSVRVIVSRDDNIRIHCVNNGGNYMDPPYINVR